MKGSWHGNVRSFLRLLKAWVRTYIIYKHSTFEIKQLTRSGLTQWKEQALGCELSNNGQGFSPGTTPLWGRGGKSDTSLALADLACFFYPPRVILADKYCMLYAFHVRCFFFVSAACKSSWHSSCYTKLAMLSSFCLHAIFCLPYCEWLPLATNVNSKRQLHPPST